MPGCGADFWGPSVCEFTVRAAQENRRSRRAFALPRDAFEGPERRSNTATNVGESQLVTQTDCAGHLFVLIVCTPKGRLRGPTADLLEVLIVWCLRRVL